MRYYVGQNAERTAGLLWAEYGGLGAGFSANLGADKLNRESEESTNEKRPGKKPSQKKSHRRESNPQPPHYECGALPIEATVA